MIDCFGSHRSHQANIVDDRTDMGSNSLISICSASMFIEFEFWSQTNQLLTLQLRQLLPLGEALGHWLAVHSASLAWGRKVRNCEGPPAIVSQITRLARCGNGNALKMPCVPATVLLASKVASATPPRPCAEAVKNERRQFMVRYQGSEGDMVPGPL